MAIKLISISPSTNTKHKYVATFQRDGTEVIVRFGAKGFQDYISYYKLNPAVAEQKKKAYIARHSCNEDWSDPLKAGTLSRYVLWNKPTLAASINSLKKQFGI
jgi:spore maturation protein CgeB